MWKSNFTARSFHAYPTHWLISTQVIIFMAFGIGAVAGDSIDKAEAMTAAKKAWDVVHLKSAIDALAPSGYDGGKGGAAATVSFEDVAFAYPTRADRPVYERLTSVWKSNFMVPSHRRDNCPVTASARWRGDSTPSTRCCSHDCGGSMAWRLTMVSRNYAQDNLTHWLISTQAHIFHRSGGSVRARGRKR